MLARAKGTPACTPSVSMLAKNRIETLGHPSRTSPASPGQPGRFMLAASPPGWTAFKKRQPRSCFEPAEESKWQIPGTHPSRAKPDSSRLAQKRDNETHRLDGCPGIRRDRGLQKPRQVDAGRERSPRGSDWPSIKISKEILASRDTDGRDFSCMRGEGAGAGYCLMEIWRLH